MRMRLKTGAIGNKQDGNVLSLLLFIYCMALPFEEALTFSFGGILKIIGFLVIGWCFIAYYKTPIRLRKLHVIWPFLLWFGYSVISFFWCNDYSWWWYFIKLYFSQILLILMVTVFQQFVNLEYIKNGVVTGALISAAVLIFLPTTSMLTVDGRRTMIVFGNEIDPNILSAIMMIALIITVERALKKQNDRLLMAMAIFLLMGILLTGSRGGVISTAVGIIVYFFLSFKERKVRRKAILIALAVLIATMIIIPFLPKNLIGSRFAWKNLLGLEEYEMGAHNRWTIWSYALPLALNKPVLGYGCGNFFYAISSVYRKTASHNLFVLLLIESGIVGLSLFVTGLWRIFRTVRKQKDHSTIALLSSVGVMCLTLDAISAKFFWISLIIAILSFGDSKKLYDV